MAIRHFACGTIPGLKRTIHPTRRSRSVIAGEMDASFRRRNMR